MSFFGYGGYGGYGGGYHTYGMNEIGKDALDAKRMARQSKNESDDVRGQLDRLHLATAAIWELVCERTGLDEDDLLAKIQEIDLRDGRLDGRIGKSAKSAPSECPACSRVNNARRLTCLYCGDPLSPSSPL